jgi:hypothetical protein
VQTPTQQPLQFWTASNMTKVITGYSHDSNGTVTQISTLDLTPLSSFRSRHLIDVSFKGYFTGYRRSRWLW